MYPNTEPDTAPHNLRATAQNSTSIAVNWLPPVKPNGIITEYHLQCSGGGEIFTSVLSGSQTATTLSGLLPYTNYSCSITAHTSVGGGPEATTSVTTKQDGKYYLIMLDCY